MAWRYRRSVKILPGVRLNFSKRGVSTTVGVRGASVNFSKRGTYVNTGIPGTGLYNRTKISDAPPRTEDTAARETPVARTPHVRKYKHRIWPWWVFGTIIVSLTHSPQLLAAYWLLLLIMMIVRPIIHHKSQAATSPGGTLQDQKSAP